MRYVIIRDDDTNALTPVECLERLYRPLLNHGLPVNLAVIPDVATDAATPDGRLEGFLVAKEGAGASTVPIGSNGRLIRYLRSNAGYKIVQHGCHHDYFEFDRRSRDEISRRLEQGTCLLTDAGLPRPDTFVAPHDKFSRPALIEVANRFRVVSSGWFELRRLPRGWWPRYIAKKLRRASHWTVNGTILLSHPGCLLSCHRNPAAILDAVVHTINSRRVTVLVTHWWEYFRDGTADERFIEVLHQTGDYLAARRDVKVISFSDLATQGIPLN